MCTVRDNCNLRAELFRNEWIKKMQEDATVESIPVGNQAFVDMVIARDDYKTKKELDEGL